jgi:hypothetical protein
MLSLKRIGGESQWKSVVVRFWFRETHLCGFLPRAPINVRSTSAKAYPSGEKAKPMVAIGVLANGDISQSDTAAKV